MRVRSGGQGESKTNGSDVFLLCYNMALSLAFD